MLWVILIGDENFSIDSIRNIKHYDSKGAYMLPLNRYSIEYKKDYIYYDFVKDLINYYEKNDVIKIPFSNPNFILMSCSSKDILNKVLSQDNFPKEVYIDDDKGRIVPVEKFTA